MAPTVWGGRLLTASSDERLPFSTASPSTREQSSRSRPWAPCPLPAHSPASEPNLAPLPLLTSSRAPPTSGVGGHIGHFLEGVQEGHSSQHSGPGEMDSGGSAVRCPHFPRFPLPESGRPQQPHLSWECSLVALELKSSQMG